MVLSGIAGLDANGIDVLEALKTKAESCDLHAFIKSTDNSEDEYEALISDLKKFCSKSESAKSSQLLCHMILIELELACLLPNSSRPIPVEYTPAYTSKQICSLKKLELTNQWIWEKLPSDEKEEISSTSFNLCPKITSNDDTLRLARFFYKIAPRIRRADTNYTIHLTNKNSVMNRNYSINQIYSENTNKTHQGLIEPEDQLAIGRIRQDSNDSIRNKFNQILDVKQEPLKSNNTKIYDEDVVDNEQKQDERKNQQGDLENENRIERQPGNGIKKNEEGVPLGRAGEKPEREQINERPKPKALDVESAFKRNGDDDRHWVEGKKLPSQLEQRFRGNLNRFPRMRVEENLAIPPPSIRKKPLLKSKFNKRFDAHDDDDISNNFITSALIFTLCIVMIYLILHNKNKVLGLIVEGCKRRRHVHGHRLTSRHIRLSQTAN